MDLLLPLLITDAAVTAIVSYKTSILERRHRELVRDYQALRATPKVVREELLSLSPFPTIVSDSKGHLSYKNPAFSKLFGSPNSLQTLDTRFGTPFFYLLSNPSLKETSCQISEGSFRVCQWPLKVGNESYGQVIQLIPTNHSQRARKHQIHFEGELITLLERLKSAVSEVSSRHEHVNPTVLRNRISTLTHEVTHLEKVLPTIRHAYEPMRSGKRAYRTPIAGSLKEVLSDIRPILRKKRVNLIHDVTALELPFARADAITLLSELLTASALLVDTESNMRIHSNAADHLLKITLPQTHLTTAQQNSIFSFAQNSPLAEISLRLCVAREVVEAAGGSLEVESTKQFGTEITLIFDGDEIFS